MRRLVLLVAFVALAAPASAAADEARVATRHPVLVEGSADAAGAGSFDVVNVQTPGEHRVVGLTGVVRVASWKALNVQAAGVNAIPPLGPPEVLEFFVENATLALALVPGDLVDLRASVNPGGEIALRLPDGGAGRPLRLATAHGEAVSAPPGYPPDVPIYWEAGWTFVGNTVYGGTSDAFPQRDEARFDVRGPVRMLVEGGNVTVADAAGARAFQLGNWTEAGATGHARVQQYARLLFEGTVEGADLPAGGHWGFAAPEMVWDVDGAVHWMRAAGEAAADGGRAAFDGAAFTLRGEFELRPAPGDLVADDAYAAAGDFTAYVDGAAVVPLREPLAPRVPLAAAALAVLLAAAVGAGVFYTRLRYDDLLGHPTRRRIHDTVGVHPGIHLRELHRHVGGAWGPFVFHYRTLLKAGYLRVTGAGRYRAVYAVGAEAGAPPLPHPVTRAVFAALPDDGAAVRAIELREHLGLSRQLLDYHLARLKAERLVVESRVGAVRLFARATPPRP